MVIHCISVKMTRMMIMQVQQFIVMRIKLGKFPKLSIHTSFKMSPVNQLNLTDPLNTTSNRPSNTDLPLHAIYHKGNSFTFQFLRLLNYLASQSVTIRNSSKWEDINYSSYSHLLKMSSSQNFIFFSFQHLTQIRDKWQTKGEGGGGKVTFTT